LVAVHLAAITFMALPQPGSGLSRSALQDPTVRAELAAWSGRLGALGWRTTPERLGERAFEVGRRWRGVRATAMAPFDPYFRYLGTWQAWHMFVAPHRFPSELHIAVREAGQWQVVYRAGAGGWLQSTLRHDRFRASIFKYGWRSNKRGRAHFVDWVARRAVDDFPRADALRVRYRRYRTSGPREARAGRVAEIARAEGSWRLEQVVELAPLRDAP
jgi:hypothetical protein